MDVKVREYQKEDKNFVLATWLRAYRTSGETVNPKVRGISSPTYFSHHQKLIESIWARPGARTLVAALEDDPGVIVGYLSYQEATTPIIHFCYVKVPFQGSGIAKLLVEAAGIDMNQRTLHTHYTDNCETLRVKYPSLEFNPYLLNNMKEAA